MFMRTKRKRNGKRGETGRRGRRGNVFFLFRRKERSKEKPFGNDYISGGRRIPAFSSPALFS